MAMTRSRRPEEVFGFFGRMMLDEGMVIISPKPEPFRRMERDFVDGLRRVPADISAPPGVNPYSYAMGRLGRWVIIWVPDE
jgi:hypothetical protein